MSYKHKLNAYVCIFTCQICYSVKCSSSITFPDCNLQVHCNYKTMDPRKCAQEVLRCKLCGTSGPAFYCEVCRFYICASCVGNHLLDESKDHKVVPFERRKFIPIFPTCSKHTPKQCDLHCEQCNIPICTRCVSSYDHLGHKADDIMMTFQRKKRNLTTRSRRTGELLFTKMPRGCVKNQISNNYY